MPVTNDELKGLYYYLTLVRTTDERCRRLFKQGRRSSAPATDFGPKT